jgi:protein-tyrosine phosphatase
MTFRVVGLSFAAVGALLALLAVRSGGAMAVVAWPGAALLLAGGAYVSGSPRPFGKRADGSLAPLSVLALLPYLAATWGLWRVQRRIWRRPPSHEVAPRLWIGQRPLPGELPPGTTLIVDLTCEFRAHPGVLVGAEYRCLPTLDGRAPDGAALARLVAAIAAHDGVMYVHCAAGHGRSAVVVACVLLARGLATDADDALRMLRAIRPTVSLTAEQRESVVAFEAGRGEGNGEGD